VRAKGKGMAGGMKTRRRGGEGKRRRERRR